MNLFIILVKPKSQYLFVISKERIFFSCSHKLQLKMTSRLILLGIAALAGYVLADAPFQESQNQPFYETFESSENYNPYHDKHPYQTRSKSSPLDKFKSLIKGSYSSVDRQTFGVGPAAPILVRYFETSQDASPKLKGINVDPFLNTGCWGCCLIVCSWIELSCGGFSSNCRA